MKKSLDRTFLNYGIRQEDMQLIESACQIGGYRCGNGSRIIYLKPFHEERNNQNESSLEEKKVTKILKKALKEIKK